MCGIIAGFNTQPKVKRGEELAPDLGPVNEFILEQFDNQMARGERGFGIIRIDPKTQEVKLDRAVHTQKFMLDLYMKESPMIIAHHRMPSSSDNTKDQTHPMVVSNKDLKYNYYIIHNGVIANTKDLYKKHNELGFSYTTEHEETFNHGKDVTTKWNDSESLAIEIALMLEGFQDKLETQGSAAFIALQMTKDWKAHKVFFARHINPLNMSNTRGKMRLSSEGEGNEINEDTMYSFETKDPDMKLSQSKIEFKPYYIPSAKPKEHPVSWGANKSTGTTLALPTSTSSDESTKATKKAEDDSKRKAIEDWTREELDTFGKEIKGTSMTNIEDRTQSFVDDMRSYIDDTIDEFVENCLNIHMTSETDIRQAMIPIGRFVRMIRQAASLSHAEVDRVIRGVEEKEPTIMESTDNDTPTILPEDVNPEDVDVHGDLIVDETTGFRMRNKKEKIGEEEPVISPFVQQPKQEETKNETKKYKHGKSFRRHIDPSHHTDTNSRRGKFGFAERGSERDDDDDRVHGGLA